MQFSKIPYFSYLLGMLFCLLMNGVNAKEERLLRHIPAEECGQCHEQIYGQWKSSVHANSTALTDPIHAAFYRAVIGDPLQEGVKKKGKYPICLQCHAPTAAKDGKTKLDSMPVYNEGVNCVTCHSFSKFKGTKKPGGGLQLGILAYEYSDSNLQGPSGRTIHPEIDSLGREAPMFKIVGNTTVLKTNAVCMGCHDIRKNFNKVALCNTGDEIASAQGTTDCQLCHMPVVNGKVDHSMLGGHSPPMVSRGLLMTMDVNTDTEQPTTTITLANQLPHNFPTGAPFRNVFIRVTAYDKDEKVIWQSSQSHPIKDDKQAVLMYALGDADGLPAPPPKATQVLADTRLKPHETRTLTYSISAEDITKVVAIAYYDLLLPGLKKKFKEVIPEELRQSQIVGTIEVKL